MKQKKKDEDVIIMTMAPVDSFNIDTNLSLYIPLIDYDVANLHYIRNVFHTLNIGYVSRVEFKTNESGGVRAFLHFESWYQNITVNNIQERILGEEGEARLVHDDPKYWILKKNINPVPENYANQLEVLRLHNLKNYSYLLEYIQTLHSTINEQSKIINTLHWWKNLHETNIEFLFKEINTIKEFLDQENNNNTDKQSHASENDWRDEGRLRKRRMVDYSEC